MDKKLLVLIVVLTSIALAGTLFLTSVQMATFDVHIYSEAYDRYDLYDTTALIKRDYVDICRKILEYLSGKTDSLYNRAIIFGSEKYLFSQRELKHMEDVRSLFRTGYTIRNLSAVFLAILLVITLIINRGSRKYAGMILFYGSLFLFLLVSLFLLLINQDFYRYFTLFHELAFPNDLWMLNPQNHLLINMFPLEFFKSMAVRILIYSSAGLLLVCFMGYFIYKTAK